MSGTTPNVGVRVFSDLSDTRSAIAVRDGAAAFCLPVPGASNDMTKDEPFIVDLYDPESLDAFPEGTLARDTLNQYINGGVISKVLFVRADENADPEEQIGLIAGDPAARTGVQGFRDALSHVGFEPSFIASPSYGALRAGGVANAAAKAIDSVCDDIIDCMGVFDTPETSREAAIEAAADHSGSYNMIAGYPQVIVNVGGSNVSRPVSTHIIAEHLKRDSEVGNPFKSAWNRTMKGVLGTSQVVSYQDGKTTHDANVLNQGGVVTVIEGNRLWGPFTTATDPTTIGYRSIKRIRTRRAVEKAVLKAGRKYLAEDLGPHAATMIYRDTADFLEDLVGLGALIAYELVWDRSINNGSVLEAGGLRVKQRFAETPDLVDLQIYSEPQPEAFDLLGGRIGAALNRLGNPNIRVAS
jgi:phage tail sheath protein FI